MFLFGRRVLLLGIVFAAACSRSPSDPPTAASLVNAEAGIPTTAPSLVGVVVAVQTDGRVLLEHRPVRPECQRQALASVTPETRILRRDGTTAALRDLRAGQPVRAWFGDTELRSCPVQVLAVAIVLE